jgi:hypothetical protein
MATALPLSRVNATPAERPQVAVMVGPIEIALGSAAGPLGKLAATLGRPDDAAR